jgi:TolB-like protein
MSFFAELKRRNVVRVGLAYVVISWLLAQVAELAFDVISAPDWVLKSILVVLLLGLPLALFFAWAFEITPEGVMLEKHVDRSQSITAKTGRKLDFIIIGVLVGAVGLLLVDKLYLSESSTDFDEIVATESQSIAVLPFVNMSGDDDYFSDGLSEELLNLLAKIPGLKVAGRTSSFAFKGRNEDLREIGDALSVSTVLEGSVRRSGERLRVTAQLVNVADGYHIWSETYDRQMADIFDIQDDVAGKITDALQLHLTPDLDRPTQNAEAYALYLEALALQVYTSGDDIILALELLDRAIALDPRFARAYELKAVFHWNTGGWLVDGTIAQRLTYATASKALELDPTLTGARTYAASSHPEWTWTMEFDAFDELIRAEPNNVSALNAFAWDMIVAGYLNEAAQLAQRVIELEPIAAEGYMRKGEALLAAGRRAEAHSNLERAAGLGDPVSMWILAGDFLIRGDDEKAIIWFEKQFSAIGYDPAEVRPFIVNVRDPDNGKAFLNQWVDAKMAGASDLNERRLLYNWYLAFGYIDEYWLGLETLEGANPKGWTNADTLEQSGMVLRHAGYAKHPKYLPRSKAMSLTALWDRRGPPDHCNKLDDEWVCE